MLWFELIYLVVTSFGVYGQVDVGGGAGHHQHGDESNQINTDNFNFEKEVVFQANTNGIYQIIPNGTYHHPSESDIYVKEMGFWWCNSVDIINSVENSGHIEYISQRLNEKRFIFQTSDDRCRSYVLTEYDLQRQPDTILLPFYTLALDRHKEDFFLLMYSISGLNENDILNDIYFRVFNVDQLYREKEEEFQPFLIPERYRKEYTVVSLCTFIFLALVVGVTGLVIKLHSNSSHLKAASPMFLYFILFGCFILSISLMIRVLKSSVDHPMLNSCVVYDFLEVLGTYIILTALLLKNFRISLIFNNNKKHDKSPYINKLIGSIIIDGKTGKCRLSDLFMLKVYAIILTPIIVVKVIMSVMEGINEDYVRLFKWRTTHDMCPIYYWTILDYFFRAMVLVFIGMVVWSNRTAPRKFNEIKLFVLIATVGVLTSVLNVLLHYFYNGKLLGFLTEKIVATSVTVFILIVGTVVVRVMKTHKIVFNVYNFFIQRRSDLSVDNTEVCSKSTDSQAIYSKTENILENPMASPLGSMKTVALSFH